MDFIIIANAWSAGRDNPTSKHRIALELIRQGNRVLWIEGSGMRAPSVGSSRDRLRMFKKVLAAFHGVRREPLTPGQPDTPAASISILSPLFIPLPRHEPIRRLNGLICRWSMRFWGGRLGFRDAILINYVPVLAEAMRGFRQSSVRLSREGRRVPASLPANASCTPRVIYHCVDRWDAFAMYDSAMMGEMDRRCCRYADVVIASAGELYDRCLRENPRTVLISHGVDWEHFRKAVLRPAAEAKDAVPNGGTTAPSSASASPAAIQQLGNPAREASPARTTIGFFGLLSEWVDQDLILALAEALPQTEVVLIGKPDVEISRLEGVGNIHLLGPKPFTVLPEHIAGFTVGIIPFVVNDLTRSVNPIKLREMLSAGCPVVSTALPEVTRAEASMRSAGTPEVARYVQVAHTHEEFIRMVRTLVDSPLSPSQRLALSNSMSTETWTAKVGEILELVSRKG